MATATLVREDDERTLPLRKFFNGLNITQHSLIYMFGDHAYIDANALVPVLKVSLTKFVNSSKRGEHYIHIKRVLYVNKYGLTRLIGNSNTEASRRLQDYIFEVIHRLETTGMVRVEDVESREKLLDLTDQLRVSHIENSHNVQLLKQVQDDLTELRTDYREASARSDEYQSKLNATEQELAELQLHFDKYHSIATRLARHVRFSSNIKSRVTHDAADEVSDLSDESDSEVSKERITRAAVLAKKEFSRIKKEKKPKVTRGKSAAQCKNCEQHIYYLMKSTDSYTDQSGNILYRWKVENTFPNTHIVDGVKTNQPIEFNHVTYMNFKDFSIDWNLGGHDVAPPYDYVWCRDLLLRDTEYNQLGTLLTLITRATETSMLELCKVYQ